MSRFRIVRTTDDDAYCESTQIEVVVRDWLTKQEAKAIYRHYNCPRYCREVGPYVTEHVRYSLETMRDGYWHDLSMEWAYREQEEFELWCGRKGINPYAIMSRY